MLGADNVTDCQPCPLGTFSQTVGAFSADTCAPCGAGKYANKTGTATELECYRCPTGTFLDTTGNDDISDCISCPPGLYCIWLLSDPSASVCNFCLSVFLEQVSVYCIVLLPFVLNY